MNLDFGEMEPDTFVFTIVYSYSGNKLCVINESIGTFHKTYPHLFNWHSIKYFNNIIRTVAPRLRCTHVILSPNLRFVCWELTHGMVYEACHFKCYVFKYSHITSELLCNWDWFINWKLGLFVYKFTNEGNSSIKPY